MKTKYFLNIITISMLLLCFSCKKLVEVDAPITSVNQGTVYENDAQAIAVLTGIYTNMSTAPLDYSSGATSTSLICSLSSDELVPAGTANQSQIEYYTNSLNSRSQGIWANVYNKIYVCNAAIEGLQGSTKITVKVKNQLLGEAKFMRAFFYFYLVNLYGDVPLAISTDYKVNSMLNRSAAATVYNQIVIDLKDAQSLLNDGYLGASLLSSTPERVRPNKWAATFLLARTFLYLKQYNESEVQASLVIDNTALYSLVSLDEVFLKNNNEAVWQLMTTGVASDYDANTKEGQLFIPQGSLNIDAVGLSNNLLSAFEIGDKRATSWIGSFSGVSYPNKYKIGAENLPSSEYSTILRLGELFLIRAEARAYQGKLIGSNSAKEDVDKIRSRAGLPGTTALTLSEMTNTILHERQVELFTEMGNRWFDLKRTNNADAILKPLKGNNWQSTDQLYPIPQSEIDQNPNLKGHQNPGYN